MKYEAFEDRKNSGDWRVEAFDDDGRCFVTIFSGPDPKQRAQEYAAWKSERR
jgi:hypothetical protein